MSYQLACGHWRTEVPGYGIGSIMSCLQCNALRTEIIGFTTSAALAAGPRSS